MALASDIARQLRAAGAAASTGLGEVALRCAGRLTACYTSREHDGA